MARASSLDASAREPRTRRARPRPRRRGRGASTRALASDDDSRKRSRRGIVFAFIASSVASVASARRGEARTEWNENANASSNASSSSNANDADGERERSAYGDLARYVDEKFAFELAVPQSWAYATKPGANALFKDPKAKYSNVGVTVSPVTINSLSAFGSVGEIGRKLAEAEGKKESTIPGGVDMLSERERVGAKSGVTFYDYEYRLITTHGNKRIYASVTIVDNTLYILNAQVYETTDPEKPTEEQKAFDEANAELYRRVGATFDVSKRIFS